MKKGYLFFIFCTVIGAIFLYRAKSPVTKSPQDFRRLVSQAPASYKTEQETTVSLFVPYWSLSKGKNIFTSYNKLIYFGISASTSGINKNEPGYLGLTAFNVAAGSKDKNLAVRMIDSQVNFHILRDIPAQKKIIEESVNIAKQNSFNGIVLDLETASLSFDSVVNRISNFVSLFSKEAHKGNMKFILVVYGDNFYRSRPFDMKLLSSLADEVMIMAYDFHKSRGNPGPNFPLNGKEQYGYDFKEMINDYLKVVPPEKLTVIFGMFGYDWIVDPENRSQKPGVPLSLSDTQKLFLGNCQFKECRARRDLTSAENTVTYTDLEKKNHVVWFEDQTSAHKKTLYLKGKRINSIALWAYSYF